MADRRVRRGFVPSRPPAPRRAAVALVLAGAVACSGSPDPAEPPPGRGWDAADVPEATRARFEDVVCGLPEAHRLRIWRGYHPERSGDLHIVPGTPNFVGAWLSHSGPWEYVQRVPLFLYGPGHVPAAGRVGRWATAADVAPTMADLMRLRFEAPDGRSLEEAVAEDRPGPPRLIVLLVWDSAGRNVLEEYPDAWPTLRGLVPRGAWFENATVGSSPSVTQAIHTTMGTGAFPRRHGLVDLRIRVEQEGITGPQSDPAYLLVPTLADTHSRAREGRPRIGFIGPDGALGLMGQGAYLEGTGRHVAIGITRGEVAPVREEMARHFRFPSYVREVGGLEEAIRRLDLEDGELDGRWLGEDVLEDPKDVLGTPAFAEYQTAILEELIRREGFGSGEETDLLFVNYRQMDVVGHTFSMHSPQMEAGLRAADDALAELMDVLDREVGEGEWVVAVTSDHGSTPDPEVSGAFVIEPRRLQEAIEGAFGREDRRVVDQLRVTQIWMDRQNLEAGGHSLEEVADFLAGFTKGDHTPEGLSPDELEEPLFEAAFPGWALETAGCLPGPDG